MESKKFDTTIFVEREGTLTHFSKMMTTSLISFGLIIVGILLFSYPANALSIQQPVGCVCKNQLPAMIDSLLKDVPENWNLYVEELVIILP
jgi:hypothetical protein